MSKEKGYDPLMDPNLRQYFSSPQVQKQLLRGGMIDESGRILSDVPGAGSKVHVINSELRRYEKDAAILAKEEADLRRRVRDLRLQKFVEEQQARRYALLKEEENIRLEITKMLRESQQGPPPPILGRPGVKEMQVQPDAVRDVLARNPEGIVSFYKEVSLHEGELLASHDGSNSTIMMNNNNESSVVESDYHHSQQHHHHHHHQTLNSSSSSSSSSSASTITTSFAAVPIVVAPVSTAPLPSDSPLRSYNGMSVWQASDFELRGSTGQSISSDAGGSISLSFIGGGGVGQLSPSFEFVPPSTASSAFPVRSSAIGSLTLVDDANRGLTSPSTQRNYVYNGGGGGGDPSSSSPSASAAEYDPASAAELIKLQTNKRLGLMTAGEASRFGLSSASSAASTTDSTGGGGGDDMMMSSPIFSSNFDRSHLATASSTLSTGSAFELDSHISKQDHNTNTNGDTSQSARDSEVDDSLMKQLRLVTAESQVRLPSEEMMMGMTKSTKFKEEESKEAEGKQTEGKETTTTDETKVE